MARPNQTTARLLLRRLFPLAGLLLVFGVTITEAGKVYWTERFSIRRAELDGTNVETIISGQDRPTGLALDLGSGKIYWTDRATGTLQRAALDGADPELLVTGIAEARAVALDVAGGKVYWGDTGGSGRLERANLDGTQREVVLQSGGPEPFGLDIDPAEGWLYWTSFGLLRRVQLDGTNTQTVYFNGNMVLEGVGLDLSLGRVYFSTQYLNVPEFTGVRRSTLDGAGMEELVAGPAADLAVDPFAGKVYWVALVGSKISRADLDGTNVEEIVTGLNSPKGVALDPGDGLPGAGSLSPAGSLRLQRESDDQLALSWEGSCLLDDTDFGVYEGVLGRFGSHRRVVCSTEGATEWLLSPTDGDTYYLVVPSNDVAEGGYGTSSAGVPRVPGVPACLPRSIETCR